MGGGKLRQGAIQRVVCSEVKDPNWVQCRGVARCSSVGRMCTWLIQKWWAAVQVCGTVESAKPAGGWTPVAKSGGQRIARRPVLRPSVVAFQEKVVRHSIQWRQSHPRSVGFVYGWAETAARGCLGGGGLGTPNATQAREPVGRKPLSPRRGDFGPCGRFKQRH